MRLGRLRIRRFPWSLRSLGPQVAAAPSRGPPNVGRYITAVNTLPNLGEEGRVRPQSVILTFLGDHVYGRDICVSSRTFIDAFARVGISEEATRSALTRMVRRGLLRRTRAGRRMYFGPTPASTEVLRDGERPAHRIDDRGWVSREPPRPIHRVPVLPDASPPAGSRCRRRGHPRAASVLVVSTRRVPRRPSRG
nr:hypothetical protein [Nonomuraea terrae]